MVSSCSEELPSHIEPKNVLLGSSNTVFNYGPFNQQVDLTVHIWLNLTNNFDESFDALLNVKGEMRITLTKDPSYTKTFTVQTSNLWDRAKFDPRTNRLIVDPGETVRFLLKWDLVDDNGRDLTAQVFKYKRDPWCIGRKFSAPEKFTVQGFMNLFDKTGYVFLPASSVEICHIDAWAPTCARPPDGQACAYYDLIPYSRR